MKRKNLVLLSTLLCTTIFIGIISDIIPQARLDHNVQTIQNELISSYESTGYGDYELDLIHKKIALLIPKLKDKMEKDENGEERLKIEVTAGETIHSNGDRFLVYGQAYIYPSSEAGKLNKIIMEYVRQTASGYTYSREKRELINPSPGFNGEKSIDSNNDIILTYYFSTGENVPFKKVNETTFSNIQRHDKKMKLIKAYKDYLRKTLQALEWNLTNIELAKVMDLLYMLEFE
ncbi:MAG: hypothetical protein OEV78_04120 [Spirochaetia bacterium]|nr:hypothetical protein [Spirochaetia bacterium]